MLKKENNIFLIFILLLISIAFISTLIIQYQLGHQPCKLCIYERIPYIFSIFLIISALFFNKYKKVILLTLSILFFFSFLLAFYHFGIEKGFFNELFICKVGSSLESLSKAQILEQLKQNPISCKDVNFKILGLSLAAINTVFSLVLSFLFIKLFLKYKNN